MKHTHKAVFVYGTPTSWCGWSGVSVNDWGDVSCPQCLSLRDKGPDQNNGCVWIIVVLIIIFAIATITRAIF